MAKLKLTYHKARRQWRKKKRVDGKDKVFYLGESGVNKTDQSAYYAALREWQKIEAGLDEDQAQREQQAEQERLDRVREEYWEVHGAVEHARENPHFEVARKLAEAAVLSNNLQDHPDFQFDDANEPDLIGEQIERFLTSFDAQVMLGHRSHSRRSSLRAHLGRFRDWEPAGGKPVGNRNVREVSASLLGDYWDALAGLLADEKISSWTAHDAMAAVKQFIKWCWERELCDLPRNIENRNLGFYVPAKTVDVYDLKEVREQIELASDRTKLYVLLAVNCGLTQRDLADLRRDEVDVRAGTITRRRSKTGTHKGVPTVSYKLWPTTVKLLTQSMEGKGELALLTQTRAALVREWTKDDGKPAKIDTVRLAHVRLLEKVNNQRKRDAEQNGAEPVELCGSFKWFRATSANMLAQQSQFKPAVSLFLGHAPATIAERHYTRADQKLLDAAVAWLGQQYGQI